MGDAAMLVETGLVRVASCWPAFTGLCLCRKWQPLPISLAASAPSAGRGCGAGPMMFLAETRRWEQSLSSRPEEHPSWGNGVWKQLQKHQQKFPCCIFVEGHSSVRNIRV